MDYGKLFGRGFEILRARPFLIALGIISALTGGNYGSFNGGNGGTNGDVDLPLPAQGFEGPIIPGNLPDFGALPIFLVLALACFIMVLVAIFFVLGAVAKGGLVAGVDDIEEGRTTGFSMAWRAAWGRLWRLIGIALLPALPALLLVLIVVITVMVTVGFAALSFDTLTQILGGATAVFILCVVCLAIPLIIALALLSNLALRAAMLEESGVIDSYRRGWEVLRQNLASAIVIFAFQIGLSIVLGFAAFAGSIFAVLCCLLWPLFIVFGGAVNAYFSSIWTLAWREWTGRAQLPAHPEETPIT